MKLAYLCALQFLTRIPVKLSDELGEQTVARSVLFYPAVGVTIGALLYLLQLLMGNLDSLLQAALLLTTWVLLTGALHIDGLADVVDGWVGAHGDKNRMLEIMKDPASGPMAVTAIVLLLLAKFAALTVVLKADALMALIIAPMLGRAGLLAALRYVPYVREQGLGSPLVSRLPENEADKTLLVTLLLVLLLAGWVGVGVILVGMVVYFWVTESFKKQLDGMTGDCAGALCEILELSVLLSICVLI